MPRIWLLYFNIFFHPLCPPLISHCHARRTFDRALRTLPPSLHSRVWVMYLLWAESKAGSTLVSVYRRYLAIDFNLTEHYTNLLLSPTNPSPRPLEAAKLLLKIVRQAARGEYVSPDGKSPYQLLGDWLDVVEKFAEEVGLGLEELSQSQSDGQTNGEPSAYGEDEDPNSLRKLDIEKIVHKDGLEIYKDQAGRLWTGLATYWIKRGDFERAKSIFEQGISTVLTIRDFTQIFDAYAEYSETLISSLMESLADSDVNDEEIKETEEVLDNMMKSFEELMDRRPFLVNDVLIRRNPNDVQEWEKRVALWGTNDQKVRRSFSYASPVLMQCPDRGDL